MTQLQSDSRIFVAGHGGLVGSAVLRRLAAGGFTAVQAATREQLDLRDQAAVNTWRIDHVYAPPWVTDRRLSLVYGDLNDASSFNRILKTVRPDEIYNVGAQAFCSHAFARLGLPLSWRGTGLAEQGLGPDGWVLVAVSPRYFRPSEVEHLFGDAAEARRELGWSPTVSFEGLVQMMTDSDLELVGA